MKHGHNIQDLLKNLKAKPVPSVNEIWAAQEAEAAKMAADEAEALKALGFLVKSIFNKHQLAI